MDISWLSVGCLLLSGVISMTELTEMHTCGGPGGPGHQRSVLGQQELKRFLSQVFDKRSISQSSVLFLSESQELSGRKGCWKEAPVGPASRHQILG